MSANNKLKEQAINQVQETPSEMTDNISGPASDLHATIPQLSVQEDNAGTPSSTKSPLHQTNLPNSLDLSVEDVDWLIDHFDK